jgi:tricorn protease-like protein
LGDDEIIVVLGNISKRGKKIVARSRCIYVLVSLLEKVEIPMKFRDRIYFFSNRDGIKDRKSS